MKPSTRIQSIKSPAMPYLLIVTLIQAFSFNLIGAYLAGHVDSYFAVLARVLIAGLVFIPLTRWRRVEASVVRRLLLIGALQFGVTYVCLYLSFRVLSVPEVLLFTILTPLHVTLIEDALNRRFNPWGLLAALTAVVGAAVIRYDRVSADFLLGFALLQVANFTYAAGQVLYKRLQACSPSSEPQYRRFGFFFVGALLIALPAFLAFGNPQHLPQTSLQWSVLLFLGLVATAFGMYAWNKGASQVGGATLAAMNNLHIPVGLVLNLLLWNQQEPLGRLAAGAAIILLSVWIARRSAHRRADGVRSSSGIDHR